MGIKPSPASNLQPRAPARKWVALAMGAGILALAYTLAGFLLLPWIAKQSLPRLVEENLHHRARIGEISFNPFTLRLQAREFALEASDGRPVLGLTDAVVDLEWRSLVRRAWILDEIRLVDFSVRAEISKQGRLNLASLAPKAEGAPSTQPLRIAIGRFSVANGSLDFEDRREGYRNRLERVSIKLASLSTLEEEKGPYALIGRTSGGATLGWKGDLSLAPLEATGTLAIGNAVLAELMPYVDNFTAARIVAGRANLELPYRFAIAGGKSRFSIEGARLDLRESALAIPGPGDLLARLGTISIAGIDFDADARRAAVKAFHIGESTIASGKEKVALAKLGSVSFAGIDFDAESRHGAVKALRIGQSSIATGKEKAALATLGPIALDGAAFDFGLRRASAGALRIDGAILAGGIAKSPLAKLEQLVLESIGFDLDSRSASAKALRVAELALALKRDANGELDLANLFAGQGGEAAKSDTPTAWQVGVGSVEIANAAARYTDLTAKTPLDLALSGLSASFKLDAASGTGGARVRLDAGKFALARFDAVSAAPGAAQPAVKLAQLSARGTRFDSEAKALEIQNLRLGGIGVDTVLDDGRPSLLDLLPAMGESKGEKPFSARVKAFELGDGSVSLVDRSSGIALALESLAAKLADVSTDGARPIGFEVSTSVRSGGRIALRGRAMPGKGALEAKVDASAISIAPVQPLLARFPGAKLTSGDASLSGTVRLGGGEAKFAYTGAASIANLGLDDAAGTRLFGWKSLATESIKATLAPNRVDIDELRVIAPAGRLAIASDGTSNISRAFAHAESPRSAAAVPDAPAVAEAAPAAGKAQATSADADAFAIAARRLRVEQGALDFSDDSLSPRYVARIYDLAGTANGLSSDHETRSQFTLEGRVDEFGYARLSGAFNPSAPRNRTAFRVQLRNIDLASASPYAMRFAGYRIATGRLALDLNYRVRESLIEGDNKITLENLTLGEHVDSPNALKLPFELAIALLKDPDGTIALDVPVSGNLDDPQFSLAPLIWKAVGNLIGSIVAAPFRALAHLFGGASGEQAGTIVFDPGRSRLLPPEREKLGRIALALAKRPELKLQIPALYDTEADERAMKRSALAREIGRRAGFAVKDNEEPGPVNIEDKPTRSALRALFAERFTRPGLDKLRTQVEEKARAAGAPPPPVTERVRNLVSGEPQVVDAREFYQTLLRRLREAQPLAPNALPQLARRRALAIEEGLKAAGADPMRIAQTTAEPTSEPEAKQVKLQLSLTAR